VRVARSGSALIAAAVLAAALLLGGAPSSLARTAKKKHGGKPPAAADFDVKLPVLGTRLAEFPPGQGKAAADLACLQCHSASMAAQQRLTDKQWAKEIDKMIGWGAAVPADQKDSLLAYLVANFGPDNDRFEPTVTRPVGR
jgi:mono/diheme cytochrome c family protein